MSEHDAEYFRQRRRAQGIPEHEPFSATKYVKQGLGLRGPEQSPWPRNLFGDYASVAELMAEAAEQSGPGEWRDDVCARAGVGASIGTTCRKPYAAGTATASTSSTSGQTRARANETGGGWGKTVASDPGKHKNPPCNQR